MKKVAILLLAVATVLLLGRAFASEAAPSATSQLVCGGPVTITAQASLTTVSCATVAPSVTATPAPTASATPSPVRTPIPTSTPPPAGAYPLHTNIVSTTFWVGEIFNPNTTDGSQVCSTYDAQWALHWGGVNDGTEPSSDPDCAGSVYGSCDGVAPNGPASCTIERRTAANGYFPSSITPLENPFYLDLPYDDLNNAHAFADRCRVVPWAQQIDPSGAHCSDPNFSYMKNQWVAITGPNGQTCYGQIEDAGPGQYDDENYVFGSANARPKSTQYNNAGLDVSPALNGCLGYAALDGENDHVSWRFVPQSAVPPGPWLRVVTTSGVTN